MDADFQFYNFMQWWHFSFAHYLWCEPYVHFFPVFNDPALVQELPKSSLVSGVVATFKLSVILDPYGHYLTKTA